MGLDGLFVLVTSSSSLPLHWNVGNGLIQDEQGDQVPESLGGSVCRVGCFFSDTNTMAGERDTHFSSSRE